MTSTELLYKIEGYLLARADGLNAEAVQELLGMLKEKPMKDPAWPILPLNPAPYPQLPSVPNPYEPWITYYDDRQTKFEYLNWKGLGKAS